MDRWVPADNGAIVGSKEEDRRAGMCAVGNDEPGAPGQDGGVEYGPIGSAGVPGRVAGCRNAHDQGRLSRVQGVLLLALTIINRGQARVVVRDPQGAWALRDPPRVDQVGVREAGDARQVGYQVGLKDVCREQTPLFQRLHPEPVPGRLPRGRPLAAPAVTTQLRSETENCHAKSPRLANTQSTLPQWEPA